MAAGAAQPIQMAAGRVLATFAERTEAAGNGQQAIAAVERLLALDPLREDWQRLALRLYARHRGQHEALAQAKAFEELLRRELDVDPEAETRALVEEIRSGDIALRGGAGGRRFIRAPGCRGRGFNACDPGG